MGKYTEHVKAFEASEAHKANLVTLIKAKASVEVTPLEPTPIDEETRGDTAECSGAVDVEAKNKEKATRAKLPRSPGSRDSPRTQKARGVLALSRIDSTPYQSPSVPMAIYGLSSSLKLLPYDMPQPSDLPGFARPCPVRPRHGFVDSRKVTSYEELLDVWGETREADPDAELILCKPFTARFSAVAANAGVTWGLGNDGATGAGKVTAFIPAPQTVKDWNKSFCCHIVHRQPDELGIDDVAYVELVEHQHAIRAVQVRDGPMQSSASYYVPEAMTPATVLKLTGEPDLLKWESDIAALATKPAPCVWAPGLALASHYAVHAIVNKIAVWTGSADPKGMALQVPKGAAKALSQSNYDRLGELVQYWAAASFEPTSPALLGANAHHEFMGKYSGMANASRDLRHSFQRSVGLTSIAVLHASATWGPDAHLLMLRAFGAVALAKMFAASCIGEARHFYTQGPGMRKQGRDSAVNWVKLGNPAGLKSGGLTRVSVYKEALEFGLSHIRTLLKQAAKDFNQTGWKNSEREGEGPREDKTGSYGYGGPKWGAAALHGISLINSINAFQLGPCEDTWTEVMEAMNVAVNIAHNGGKILNKWIEQNEMDLCARAPGLGFCNSVAGLIALKGAGAL